MEKSCKKCSFYCMKDSTCRKNPPQPGRYDNPVFLGVWIGVKPEDWCGEFEPRIDAYKTPE